MNKALFLDFDGTVRRSRHHDTKIPMLCPNVPDDIWQVRGTGKLFGYKRKGYKIIGVTNQGGIALKHLTFAQAWNCVRATQDKLGFRMDRVYMSPAINPENENRKPNPGMAFQARDKFNLDLSQCIMVGDMPSDKEFAENAGIGLYRWADDFFEAWPESTDGQLELGL